MIFILKNKYTIILLNAEDFYYKFNLQYSFLPLIIFINSQKYK